MAKYLFESKYTAEGLRGVMKEGGSKRREAAEQVIKSVGGKLESFYFAFGERDVVGIIDVPDSSSAVAVSGAINSTGTSTIRLTPLITVEDVDGAAKKTAQYRPPGR